MFLLLPCLLAEKKKNYNLGDIQIIRHTFWPILDPLAMCHLVDPAFRFVIIVESFNRDYFRLF
jgi:hypothetical protein